MAKSKPLEDFICRVDGKVVIRSAQDRSNIDGAVAVEPKTGGNGIRYTRTFENPKKRIFLPPEKDEAITMLRGSGADVLTVGMTGYSSLKPEHCKAWGIIPGHYEAACASLLGRTIRHLQDTYEGVRIVLTHGASDMGIDRVVIDVAKKLNLDQLGFNCPEWMWYVRDDEIPVYVAPNKDAYGDCFVRNTDILLSVGGREQSLVNDITSAIKYGKCLIVCPVMNAISSNGGPPSRDGEGKIQDATQALMECLRIPSLCGPTRPIANFEELTTYATLNAAQFAQTQLSAARAFPW